MTKKILVACGTAIATSTVVAKKIEKLCKDQGIPCMLVQCKATEALSKSKTLQPDVIVSTIELPEITEIPVINGRPFLTGVELDETVEALLATIKD
ncbi:PTS sugar transporter subunit IIB [Alkalibacter rhizosphaerae]|uniref:PTS sugar transporter subunit IIB n=1 Tax=Alkalibacter rhizosphaerae TaxID=2815577 RepID=A0A974XEB0_9FIRM|nr:PTS sugar transporter subunit IIB [Alkalibacter rhizosphaerae]QSX08171.1 PTS sugar transporter subunit IIB [Alkalibacter rhizosphaerae]